MPVVQDTLALEALNLQKVKQTVAVLNEIAYELRHVAVLLNLKEVLAEQSKQIGGHQLRLLQCTRPAIHHGEVLDVV